MKDKPIILAVDDLPQNNELIEAYLVPQGYEIIKAASGEEALKILSEDQIDLVLLDIMMPNMNGFEVLEKLRADKKTRLIPVVMVTALRETEDRVKALEAGCDDFISKPFEKTELLARVKSLLRISYYRNKLDEKEKFEMVINEMGDGVVVCSPDWIIAEINSAAAKYLNVSDGKGKNLLDLFFGGFSPTIAREEIIDSAKPKKVFDIVRTETERSKAFYLETNIGRIKDPEGKVTRIVALLSDVTEKRREELLKADFLGLISHKLKTPITVALGYLDAIKGNSSEQSSKDRSSNFVVVLKSINAIKRLIDRLIFFVTTNQPRAKKTKYATALASAIEACRKLIIETYLDKKINFSGDLPGDIPPLLIGEEELNAILFELADNAVKFNDKPEVSIMLSGKKDPSGFVAVAIEDNGVGIASENYDTIFDRFSQAEKNFTGNVEGLGLGLPLAKKLVEDAGGKIWVESKLGKGSVFYFLLKMYE